MTLLMFRHAQAVSNDDAEDLYCSGSLDAWYIGGGGCTRVFRRLLKKTTSEYFVGFTGFTLKIVRLCLAV